MICLGVRRGRRCRGAWHAPGDLPELLGGRQMAPRRFDALAEGDGYGHDLVMAAHALLPCPGRRVRTVPW